MRIAYRRLNKLGKFIKVYKDKLDNLMKNNIVYKINCRDCDMTYVGQIGKRLKTRLAEHRRIPTDSSSKSVVAEHRFTTNHDFDWDKFQFSMRNLTFPNAWCQR